MQVIRIANWLNKEIPARNEGEVDHSDLIEEVPLLITQFKSVNMNTTDAVVSHNLFQKTNEDFPRLLKYLKLNNWLYQCSAWWIFFPLLFYIRYQIPMSTYIKDIKTFCATHVDLTHCRQKLRLDVTWYQVVHSRISTSVRDTAYVGLLDRPSRKLNYFMETEIAVYVQRQG